VLSGTNFIGAAGDRMMIRFLRKSAFLFQQPTQSGRGILEPKGESLKDFEVHGISKKEPLHNRQKAINPIVTVICPK
jgi:hypothetical protein